MLEQSLKNMLTYQKHQMVNIQLVQHHIGESISQLTRNTFMEVVPQLVLQLSVLEQIQLTL